MFSLNKDSLPLFLLFYLIVRKNAPLDPPFIHSFTHPFNKLIQWLWCRMFITQTSFAVIIFFNLFFVCDLLFYLRCTGMSVSFYIPSYSMSHWRATAFNYKSISRNLHITMNEINQRAKGTWLKTDWICLRKRGNNAIYHALTTWMNLQKTRTYSEPLSPPHHSYSMCVNSHPHSVINGPHEGWKQFSPCWRWKLHLKCDIVVKE